MVSINVSEEYME